MLTTNLGQGIRSGSLVHAHSGVETETRQPIGARDVPGRSRARRDDPHARPPRQSRGTRWDGSRSESAEVIALFNSALDLVPVLAASVRQPIRTAHMKDDLVSAGLEGLLHAARRYDPTRGVPFPRFARHRIRGAMLDTLRGLAPLPRTVHARINSSRSAARMNDRGAELASDGPDRSRLDSTEAALAEHLAGMEVAVALGIVVPEGGSGKSVPTPEELVIAAEVFELVRRTIKNLKPDERAVIYGVYFQNLDIQEAGRALGIDKSWASRLHKRAITRLTKRLHGHRS